MLCEIEYRELSCCKFRAMHLESGCIVNFLRFIAPGKFLLFSSTMWSFFGPFLFNEIVVQCDWADRMGGTASGSRP